jgi:hypothetical protein
MKVKTKEVKITGQKTKFSKVEERAETTIGRKN